MRIGSTAEPAGVVVLGCVVAFGILAGVAGLAGLVSVSVSVSVPRRSARAARRQHEQPTATASAALRYEVRLQCETNSTAEDEGQQALREGWEANRKLLCPNQTPQGLKYQPHLFLAAQRAIGLTTDLQPLRDSKQMWVSFFRHSHGGFVLKDAETKKIVSYIRLWKNANNQIGDYSNKKLSHLGEFKWYEGAHGKFSLIVTHSDCVVVVLRDPAARFLSGYNEFEYRIDELDLLPHPAAQAHVRFAPGSPQRVDAFLADWLTGLKKVGWDSTVTKKSTEVQLMHMYPQAAYLHLLHSKTQGGPKATRKVAVLPSISDIQAEFPKVLNESCGLPASRLPEMTQDGQHKSSTDPFGTYAAAKAVWKSGGPSAKAICALTAMDYACFHEYFELPEVCLDILGAPGLLTEKLSWQGDATSGRVGKLNRYLHSS